MFVAAAEVFAPSTVEPVPEPVPAMELTVLMPCLNEARTVGTCVAAARRFLQEAGGIL